MLAATTVRLGLWALDRATPDLDEPAQLAKGNVAVHGFQAEIDAEKDAGMLYETGGRAYVSWPKPEWVQKHFKAGDWNEMVVIAEGRHLKALVNGAVASELLDDPGAPAIDVQVDHLGEVVSLTRFRELLVELAMAPPAYPPAVSEEALS